MNLERKIVKRTVVIPTYNEKENLPLIVRALLDLGLEGLGILVVDDNSPDGTGLVADQLAEEYPGIIEVLHRPGKQGLGTAYLEGFKVCLEKGADQIIQMDADFSHDPQKGMELVEGLDEYDMVLGSRYVPGGSLDRDWGIWRKRLSSFGNLYARTILGLKILDITGGFRAWRRETLEQIPRERVKSQGYSFQVEMAYITHLAGFKIKEIPIYFAERTRGDSKMSLKIQVEAARRVWGILLEYRDLR